MHGSGDLESTINQFTGFNFNIWKVFFKAITILKSEVQRSPDTEPASWNQQDKRNESQITDKVSRVVNNKKRDSKHTSWCYSLRLLPKTTQIMKTDKKE